MIKSTIVYLKPLKNALDVDQQRKEVLQHLDKCSNIQLYEDLSGEDSSLLKKILNSINCTSGILFVVWRIDAIAQAFSELDGLLNFAGEILKNDNDFLSVSDHLDTRKPKGTILSAISETYKSRALELKIERQRIAMYKLSASGANIGRPRLHNLVNANVYEMKKAGETLKAIAEKLKTSPSTIHRILHRSKD